MKLCVCLLRIWKQLTEAFFAGHANEKALIPDYLLAISKVECRPLAYSKSKIR